jgi:hypothetical protein
MTGRAIARAFLGLRSRQLRARATADYDANTKERQTERLAHSYQPL